MKLRHTWLSWLEVLVLLFSTSGCYKTPRVRIALSTFPVFRIWISPFLKWGIADGRRIGFSILAAGAVFFAYFRYLAQSWKTMLVAKSVAVVRAALAPVARSGWAWFILVLLFWGYLTAGPLIDYYATQVASQTEARKSALSDHERAVYEGRLSKYQEEIVGANDVEMAYEQKNQKIISQSIK
jgi:hypothetical protein